MSSISMSFGPASRYTVYRKIAAMTAPLREGLPPIVDDGARVLILG